MQPIQEDFEIFSTSDPDQFIELLQPVLPTKIQVAAYGRKTFDTRVKMIHLPQIGIFRIQASQFQAHDFGFRNFTCFTIPLTGAIEILEGNQYRQYTQGHANTIRADEPIDLQTKYSSNLVLNCPSPYLNRVSSKLSGTDDPTFFKTTTSFSLQTPEGITLWHLLSSTWTELCRHPELLTSASSIQERQDNLVSLLLLSMNPDEKSITKSRRLCRQLASLKAAEEYICANLENPVSISDIAAAAKLHPRTLFRLFKKRHAASPMAFLKQRRLEAVQRSLLGAPAESNCVTQHAMKFGLYHLGQFAVDYRQAFGESPSETLSR